jgi:hypothetical protein
VIFQDGMLRYYGLSTSFRLSPNVVTGPADRFDNGPFERNKKAGNAMGDHAKAIAWGFQLRDQPDTTVWFWPNTEEEKAVRFRRDLYRWLFGAHVPNDNSILPPLSPRPKPPKPVGLTRKMVRLARSRKRAKRAQGR